MTLSDIIKASFSMSPAQLSLIKDPVVTIGNGAVRFEGFSQCAGVYARVDVLEGENKEAFIASGTTNVDFNAGTIAALGKVTKDSPFELNVGKKAVAVTTDKDKVVEKKVPLPNKWIKGLTTV